MNETVEYNLLLSGYGTGSYNMALDEALFNAFIENQIARPILRFYTWEHPCVTIGYFQRHSDFLSLELPIVRRLTGGLSVRHSNDLSYSFITSSCYSEFIYDQKKTYQCIHSAIREGLALANIKTDFYGGPGPSRGDADGICVNNLFSYDLHLCGKKVVGSCQRRRGKYLIQQGSIHIPSFDYQNIVDALARGFENYLAVKLSRIIVSDLPSMELIDLIENKYDSDRWNRKF